MNEYIVQERRAQMKNVNAQLFLLINSVLWGSSYVWSKMLLSFLPGYSILLLCSTGGLITAMIIYFRSVKQISHKTAFKCILISIVSVVSNVFFMLALKYTSSSNTAFIVQMSVIITPVLVAFLNRKMPGKKIIISALTAVIGLFILTCDFKTFQFNIGDLLALGNALFFSIFIVSQSRITKKVEIANFSLIYYLTNTVVFLLFAGLFEFSSVNISALVNMKFIMLMVASMLVTIFTFLLQFIAISRVQPEKATLIYTIEPMVATILAFVCMSENINWNTIIGCAFIITSVLYCIYMPKLTNKKTTIVYLHYANKGAKLMESK